MMCRRSPREWLGCQGSTSLNMVHDNPCALSYIALKWEGFLTSLPPDGTVPCDLKLVDSSKGRCTNDSWFVCMTPEVWGSNVSCSKGRFVPPKCQTTDGSFSPHCSEVLMGHAEWSEGWWEAVVLNLGLNLTLNYLGPNLQSEVRRRGEAHEPMMFYSWEPSMAVVAFDAHQVHFLPSSQACTSSYSPNPYASGVRCTESAATLHTVLSKAAPQAIREFWSRTEFTNTIVNDMMKGHRQAGGGQDSRGAVCRWLQENPEVWKPWIANQATDPDQQMVTNRAMTITLVGVGLACIGITGFLVWRRRTRVRQKLSLAPAGEVVFMCTSIQGFTELMDVMPNEMAIAMTTYQQVMRTTLKKYKGYESRVFGDYFLIVYPDALSSVQCAVEIQEKLLDCPWPEALAQEPFSSTVIQEDQTLFQGLRVQVGLYLGKAERKWCAVADRVEYSGRDVSLALKTATRAAGGQILITGRLYDKLLPTWERDAFGLQELGNHRFPGVLAMHMLVSVVPPSLCERVFSSISKSVCIKCQQDLLCPFCEASIQGTVSNAGMQARVNPHASHQSGIPSPRRSVIPSVPKIRSFFRKHILRNTSVVERSTMLPRPIPTLNSVSDHSLESRSTSGLLPPRGDSEILAPGVLSEILLPGVVSEILSPGVSGAVAGVPSAS